MFGAQIRAFGMPSLYYVVERKHIVNAARGCLSPVEMHDNPMASRPELRHEPTSDPLIPTSGGPEQRFQISPLARFVSCRLFLSLFRGDVRDEVSEYSGKRDSDTPFFGRVTNSLFTHFGWFADG